MLVGLAVLAVLLAGVGYLISAQPGKAPGARLLEPSSANEPALASSPSSSAVQSPAASSPSTQSPSVQSPSGQSSSGPSPSGGTSRPAQPAAGGPQAAPVPAGSKPARVRVPSICVDSTLQPLGLLPDGSLQSPSKPRQAGWYAGGVAPGDGGSAVIAGQASATAVFAELHRVRPGDPVLITRQDGSVLRFVVDDVRTYPKRAFPSAGVYARTGKPVLRLITSTGSFDDQAPDTPDSVLVVSARLS